MENQTDYTKNHNPTANASSKDPVCGMDLKSNQVKTTSEYKGNAYSFCSEDCRDRFEQNPSKYSSVSQVA